MFWFWKRHAFMDTAGDGGAAGGGGAAGSGNGGAAAAAAGAGAAGGGGAAAGSGESGASGGAASALAGGGGTAAAASTGAAPAEWVPEKYRVNKPDGTFDVEASARKLADGYGELSKRFGEGGAAPKSADEYQVAVPDALKEVIGDLSKDEMFTKFRADMHGLGLSQKQFDGVMSRYFELAPALAAGAGQLNTEAATTALQTAWPDQAAYKANLQMAYRASAVVAGAAKMSYEDIEKAGLANNPTFIRLMAAIGPEFGEDRPIAEGQPTGFTSEDEIKQLLTSEANTNTKHPQHAATRAKVDAYYARKYGTATIA